MDLLKIRDVRLTDAFSILAIYRGSVEESAISFEDSVPTLAEMESRIGMIIAKFPWLVAEDERGAVIAYAYASPHRDRAAYRWTCEVSVYVSSQHLKKGVGSALYRELFALLRSFGYQSALAGITLPNSASIHLHESFGFEKIAVYKNVGFKDGLWRDVGWWQLQLRQADTDPLEPRNHRVTPLD